MKKDTNVIIVVFLVVISFACLSIGTAYAYLSTVSVGGTQNITTGNLSANLTINGMENVEIAPMSDEEGLNQTTYAKVVIDKNNQYTVFYSLNLSYSMDSLPSTLTKDDLLPLDFIKVAVFASDTDSIASAVQISDPVKITELPMQSVDTTDHYNDEYMLTFNTFKVQSDKKYYFIKAWLVQDTPDTLDGKYIYLDANVNQEPLVSKSLYNFTNISVSLDTTALSSGYTIKLQKGAITGTTSLTNVPTGTYLLEVVYNGNTYSTTVKIKEVDDTNTTEGVSTLSGKTCGANEPLQNCAYTYYTTIDKLIRKNDITTYSNVNPTTSYNVPNSYVIVGKDSLGVSEISGLKLTLNSSDYSITLSK